MESIRCGGCNALLLRAAPHAISAAIEIKCRRCGALNHLRRWLDADASLQPAILGMDHGVADWLDRYRLCGNGAVPLAAANALRTLAAELTRSNAVI